jgi:ribosomal protein L37AE/L43A
LSAKAGEVARETGPYRCEGCGQQAMVKEGVIIRECRDCGSASFQTGWRTLANQAANAQPVLDGVG